MVSAGELAMARRAAEDQMDDTCTVVRRSRGSLNNETGKYGLVETRIYPPVIDADDPDEPTSGPCRVKQSNVSRPAEIDAAGQLLVETASTISLPIIGSEGVELNDIVIIATSRFDPDLPGAEFRISGPHNQTHASARRFPAERTS